jgi:Uma2 family endonuclease
MVVHMNMVMRKPMSLQEFLAWEEVQELRYEFNGYEPVAMAGGTAEHDAISMNIAAALVTRLRGKPCRARGSNLKVEVMGRIRYPDAYVTCKPLVPGAKKTSDPVVIFEVLSESTADTDKVEKNREYRNIDTLTHYVMLEQDRIGGEVLERRGGEWVSEIVGADAILRFPEIGIEIPLLELYDGLNLQEKP